MINIYTGLKSGLNSILKDMEINGFDSNYPIIIYVDDGKALIVDGHHRFLAAKELGYKRVPIKYIQKDRIYSLYGRTLGELRALSFK